MVRPKLIIFLTVLIDVIGMGIVLPTLPIFVTEYGATKFQAASLFTVYALCAFLAAPLLGMLSDRWGRRPVLIASLSGTFLGWVSFTSAYFFPQVFLSILFVGRIIDGLTAGNISVAQSYLVDLSKDNKSRTINLGLIGAAFGLGFVLGPAIGGLLSQISIIAPFVLAAILSFFNAVAAFYFLPETHFKRSSKSFSLNPFRPIVSVIRNPQLRMLFVIWFFLYLAFANIQSIFALYAKFQFNMDQVGIGLLLALVGVIAAVNQGVLLKRVWLKYFQESHLQLIFVFVLWIAFGLIATGSLKSLWIGLVALAFSQSMLRVTVNSQVAGSASSDQRGEVLGTLNSVALLASVLAPFLGGFFIEKNLSLPWWVCMGYVAFAAILIVGRFIRSSR